MTAKVIEFLPAYQARRDAAQGAAMQRIGPLVDAIIRGLLEHERGWNKGRAMCLLYDRGICATMAEASARVDEIMR